MLEAGLYGSLMELGLPHSRMERSASQFLFFSLGYPEIVDGSCERCYDGASTASRALEEAQNRFVQTPTSC